MIVELDTSAVPENISQSLDRSFKIAYFVHEDYNINIFLMVHNLLNIHMFHENIQDEQ
jgi:hypothetical protein